MKFELEFDEKEMFVMIKDEWYRKIRKELLYSFQQNANDMVIKFLKDNDIEFKILLKESLKDVLKEFTIKDLKEYIAVINKGEVLLKKHNEKEEQEKDEIRKAWGLSD